MNSPEGTACRVHGVDGCRGGWLCASLSLDAAGQSLELSFRLYPAFTDCLADTADDIVVVDIPVGLLDRPATGGRPCDRSARKLLGSPRRNSVFPPPVRPALEAFDYREAIRLNGQGMTRQAFNIMPRIREVDEAIAPSDQARVFEGHPEMSFMRLAGGPIAEPKRKKTGRDRRQDILQSEHGFRFDLSAIRKRFGRALVAHDDILDAVALALTGRNIHAGTAERTGTDERDSRGLQMAIWY